MKLTVNTPAPKPLSPSVIVIVLLVGRLFESNKSGAEPLDYCSPSQIDNEQDEHYTSPEGPLQAELR